MFTELTVIFKQDLPENISKALEKVMGASKDVQDAIKTSTHLDDGFLVFLDDIVYTGISRDKLFIILKGDDIRTLKIHLENKNVATPSKVTGLKESAETMHQTLKMFSRRNDLKIRNIKAVIVAEDEQIEKGSLQNRTEYLKSIIRDDYEKDIILAIVIFLISLVGYYGSTSLESALVSAGTNVLVLIIAAGIILGIRLLFYKPMLEYKQ